MLEQRLGATAATKETNIDLEKRVIKNVIMGQVGEAKGHGVHVEEEFLADAAKFFNSKMKDGVKCNFGHNWENIGLTLGRFKNVRHENEKLIGDLHLHKSADLSPKAPNSAAWLLSMSEEDPKAVMSSLVFQASQYYQKTKSGEKIQVYYYDDDGNWISKNTSLGKVFVGFGEGRSCDMVEDGAITDSLFSGCTLLDQFQRFLGNPQFPVVLEEYGDKFPVLAEYYNSKQKEGFVKKLKKFLAPQPDITEELSEKEAELKKLNKKYQKALAKAEKRKAKAQELKTSLATAEEKISDQKKELETLRADETVEHTTGKRTSKNTTDQGGDEAWMSNPINQVKLK